MVVRSKLYWSVPSIVRLAWLLSWVVAPACPWSKRFCLLCTCHTPAWWSCRLYLALPCLLHLLPGLHGRLCGSACLFLSSSYVWFASLYCCLCLSLSRSDLASKTFFLRAVLSGFPVILCDPLLHLPLLCSKAGFAGLLVGYLKLLPLCIDVSQAFQRLIFSIC